MRHDGRVLKGEDSSAANPDNPDPTVDVGNGPQTATDEMVFYAIEWVMPNRRP